LAGGRKSGLRERGKSFSILLHPASSDFHRLGVLCCLCPHNAKLATMKAYLANVASLPAKLTQELGLDSMFSSPTLRISTFMFVRTQRQPKHHYR
jgi:hypothetical protein